MYLFIHHCDLRIIDNTTLNKLLSEGHDVQPIFIFTPKQIIHNPYKSDNSIQFMSESLRDLEHSYSINNIKLQYFLGDTLEVLVELLKNTKGIRGIAFNMDYTPFAIYREELVRDLCDKNNIECISLEDKLLNPVDCIETNSGTKYTKFTPYYKKAVELDIRRPETFPLILPSGSISYTRHSTTLSQIKKYYKSNPKLLLRGGRQLGLKRLKDFNGHKDYDQIRNIPTIETTRISPYLKFGCISIREAYFEALKTRTELVKQLYWRDFYNMILFYYPSVSEEVSVTKEHMNNIQWINNVEHFKRWCEGKTGCPIVDAGMREMNTTGYMHNRLRMIVATFLVFYLKIDWRWGMKYFSQKLVDIDWANNVGNWQWTAGTEKWSNDYYKVFSMESQVKRFDPECLYIKLWIPELRDVDLEDLVKWNTNNYSVKGYPEPIITDNKVARKEGIQMIKDAIIS
jgi:deoxyribodipyrimidine photo-lyase